MGFLDKINLVWQKVGLVQRALLIAIILACVITGGLLTKWATKPSMELLYRGLGPEEAGAMVDKINESDVLYELRSNGSAIYVAADKVHQLRLTMASEGLLQNNQQGYEIFDKAKIGVSPLVQQMNFNRAMQDELSKSIQMIDGVIFARVHIVRAEETMFAGDEDTATASVILQLKPGWHIGHGSISAITNLVASATDGLATENVTVVDSRGELLSSNVKGNGIISSANTFMDYKQRVEQAEARKIQEILDTILGSGRSTVKVSATLDMISETIEKVEYQKGIESKTSSTSTSTAKAVAMDKEGKPLPAADPDTSETTETENEIPKTITLKTTVPGKIVSLSVSATVDLNIPEPVVAKEEAVGKDAAEEESTTAPAVAKKIMTEEQVKSIIRSAVGPNLLKDSESGEELLTVVDVPFSRPAITIMPESGGYEKLSRYIEIARQSSMGVLAICALLVLKIFTGARKKAGPAIESSEAAGQMGGGLGLGMLPAGGAMDNTAALRQHVASELKENPEQVKQLFAAWLAEE